jgi:CO/xanthine dehydrogenase FAD-binding subunit
MDEARSCCEDVTIALGVAAPTPIRVGGAEETLKGKRITEEILTRVSALASEEAKPRDSVRSSAEYRRAMINNLLPEVIKTALSRIPKNGGKHP